MDTEDDISTPPDDALEVRRTPSGHGWMIRFDGEVQACFSSAADMCQWIETMLAPLDIEAGVIPRSAPVQPISDEDVPRVIARAQEQIARKPARMWRVFAGGRS